MLRQTCRTAVRTFRLNRAILSRHKSEFTGHTQPAEHKVLLDGQTLYINEDVARALGWTPETGSAGVQLTLRGWSPTFFAVTKTGSEEDELARRTVESGQDAAMRGVLDYLKDR